MLAETGTTNVLVLGGGYAGMIAALRLSRKIRGRQVRITLINGRDYFVERIRLHQQAAGQQVDRRSYQSLLAGTPVQFLQGWVSRLEPDAKRVTVSTAAGERRLRYDYAIYALGSIVDDHSVPGAAEHAYSLSTAETTEVLRSQLPELAARQGKLVVVGGGLTGIEAASEVAATYPGVEITLVTAGEFGDDLSPAGRRHLRKVFARLGIAVADGQQITAVHAQAVETEQGISFPFDICLWAGSFRAPAIARKAGLPVNGRDQVLVDEQLRVQGRSDLYVVGDAAWLAGALAVPIRMGCVTAAPMGGYAGNHLAAVIRGADRVGPFRFRYLMRCISLGREDGLIQFVSADDTPKDRILRGRVGALVKEVVSRSSVWNIVLERRLAALLAGNGVIQAERAPAAA